jgi:hypothetical protein
MSFRETTTARSQGARAPAMTDPASARGPGPRENGVIPFHREHESVLLLDSVAFYATTFDQATITSSSRASARLQVLTEPARTGTRPGSARWNVMKRGLAGDNLWVVEATSTGRPE